MMKRTREYGKLPTTGHRVVLIACLAAAAALMAVGLVITFFTPIGPEWGWTVILAGFGAGFAGLYVWVRSANS